MTNFFAPSHIGTGNPGWTKGISGNPGGRRKRRDDEIDLQAACRKHTQAALDTILRLMKHADTDTVRLRAAQHVIERAWGLPTQHNTHSGPNGAPIATATALVVPGMLTAEQWEQVYRSYRLTASAEPDVAALPNAA